MASAFHVSGFKVSRLQKSLIERPLQLHADFLRFRSAGAIESESGRPALTQLSSLVSLCLGGKYLAILGREGQPLPIQIPGSIIQILEPIPAKTTL